MNKGSLKHKKRIQVQIIDLLLTWSNFQCWRSHPSVKHVARYFKFSIEIGCVFYSVQDKLFMPHLKNWYIKTNLRKELSFKNILGSPLNWMTLVSRDTVISILEVWHFNWELQRALAVSPHHREFKLFCRNHSPFLSQLEGRLLHDTKPTENISSGAMINTYSVWAQLPGIVKKAFLIPGFASVNIGIPS